jgi:hypothetical protein
MCATPTKHTPPQEWDKREGEKRQKSYKVVPILWRKELKPHCNVTSDREEAGQTLGGWTS